MEFSRGKIQRPIHVIIFSIATVFMMSIAVSAQQPAVQTAFDRGVPPQHVAGVSPVGSYVSSELGTINVANGSLNFRIPLGSVGGRGFWIPLTLNYSSKIWSPSRGTGAVLDTSGTPKQAPFVFADFSDPGRPTDIYNLIAPGWTIGAVPLLSVKGVGINPIHNPSTGGTNYSGVLEKLTLVMPDGGSVDFRDDLTDGAPQSPIADSQTGSLDQDQNRGNVWHATDGSGMIFVGANSNGVVTGDISGVVITADGTRYAFVNTRVFQPLATPQVNNVARCTQITDRNGNIITIGYHTDSTAQTQTITYTDQLGRVTTIQKSLVNSGSSPTVGTAFTVTFPGYNGQQVTFQGLIGLMSASYAPGVNPSLQKVVNGDLDPQGIFGFGSEIALFPSSYGGGWERIDNWGVLNQLTLPDGRSLKFSYDLFGEVSQVQLPTGGIITYSYSAVIPGSSTSGAPVPGLPSGNSPTWEVHPVPVDLESDVKDIDRAVTQKQTFPNGGSAMEGSWTYTYTATTAGNPASGGVTEVKCSDSSGNLLMDEKHYFLDAQEFVSSTGGGTRYSLWSSSLEKRSEMLDSLGHVIIANEQDWAQRAALNWTTGFPSEQIPNDNRVTESRRILDDGSIAKTDYKYDGDGAAPGSLPPDFRANNVTDVFEYDFDQTTVLRHTITAYVQNGGYGSYNSPPQTAALGKPFLMRLVQSKTIKGAGAAVASQTTYEYDNYNSTDGKHAVLMDYGSAVTNHDEADYSASANTLRGNATSVTLSPAGPSGSVTSYTQYDVLGNVVATIDARVNATTDPIDSPNVPADHTTTFSYLDSFGTGSAPASGQQGSAGPTYALPTSVTSPPPQPSQALQVAHSQYDYSTGLLTGFQDRNGTITQTFYSDPFNRPTQIVTAVGVSGVSQTTNLHYAGAGAATIATTHFGRVTLTNEDVLTIKDQSSGDQAMEDLVRTDGFGRSVDSFTGDPEGNDDVNTTYDGLGRMSQVSNPFRGATPNNGSTTTGYDLAGRAVKVTTADNAVVTTDYSGGPKTKVTDQALNVKTSQVDGAGRLIQVTEDPTGLGYITKYSYDALDDLLTVTQGTQPKRQFTYDGRALLLTAQNPESGTVTCSYDEDGNLVSKTDARNAKTSYVYDNLNRITQRKYDLSAATGNVQPTPNVTYSYDTAGGTGIGRIASVSSSVSTYNYTTYDAMGRVTAATQHTNSTDYVMTYSYDVDGELLTETYPSTRKITYGYDTAGHLTSINGQKAGESNKGYAGSISYAPQGAMSAMTLGNNLVEHTSYNIRLQPTQIGLGTSSTDSSTLQLDYTYGLIVTNPQTQLPTLDQTKNNGCIQSETTTAGAAQTPMVQTFTYDAVNRLSMATEMAGSATNWQRGFSYDQSGNMWSPLANASGIMPGSSTPILQTNYNANTNQLMLGNSNYDSSGNQVKDPSGDTILYDAENRMIQFSAQSGNQSAVYSYDADGRRISKQVTVLIGSNPTTTTTTYVYNLSGQLVAEYGGPAPATTGTSYLTTDHLGSTRVITSSDSSPKVLQRSDYLPFGEEIGNVGTGRTGVAGYSTSTDIRQRFTSQQRDTESQLDFFEARYCSSPQGRFTSPDPTLLSVKSTDPQTWNRYAYVQNNPLLYLDPLGLWETEFELLYKTDKKGNKHLDQANVYFKRSKEGDNGSTLVAQLGIDPNSKEGKALAAKIDKQIAGGDGKVRLSKVGGDVGRIFGAVEDGLTAQGKYNESHPSAVNKGPSNEDCSLNTCKIAFPDAVNSIEQQQGRREVGTPTMDNIIGVMNQQFRVRSVSESELRVGDFIRYANAQGPQHFATFIFRNDDGVPQIFSKSGQTGPYEIIDYNSRALSGYGSIQGRSGTGETGFYRPR